jgi:hypothetical protein
MNRTRTEIINQLEKDLQLLWKLKNNITFMAGNLSKHSRKTKSYLTRHATTIWRHAALRVLRGEAVKSYVCKPSYCRIELVLGHVFTLGTGGKS